MFPIEGVKFLLKYLSLHVLHNNFEDTVYITAFH